MPVRRFCGFNGGERVNDGSMECHPYRIRYRWQDRCRSTKRKAAVVTVILPRVAGSGVGAWTALGSLTAKLPGGIEPVPEHRAGEAGQHDRVSDQQDEESANRAAHVHKGALDDLAAPCEALVDAASRPASTPRTL